MMLMFSQGLSTFQCCNEALELGLLFLSTSLYLYICYVPQSHHLILGLHGSNHQRR
nr:MAG TPA: hypothetical protein [Caudoviricetes sp.]